jgi:hypothetical protein
VHPQQARCDGEIYFFPVKDPPANKHRADPSNAPYGNKLKLTVTSGKVVASTDRHLIMKRRKATFNIQPLPLPTWTSHPSFAMTVTKDFRVEEQDEDDRLNLAWYSFDGKHTSSFADYEEEWIAAYVATVDVVVDTNNNHPYGGVDYSDETDSKESSNDADTGPNLAKILVPNTAPNTPTSTKPGWADFTACVEKGEKGLFASMHVHLHGFPPDTKIKFLYDGNDPSLVKTNPDGSWFMPDGSLRIWTQNVNASRKSQSIPTGHYVTPTTSYSLNDLAQAKVSDGHFVFYIEAVQASTKPNGQTIEVQIQPPLPAGSSWVSIDKVDFAQVKIKQLNYPTSANTTDLDSTAEKSIPHDGVAYITGIPEMPQLEASIGSGSLSGMTVEWRLEVKTERTPERGTKDDFKIPTTGTTSVSIDQPWKIHESFTAPHDFFGGKVSVFYRIKKNGGGYLINEQEIKFKIHGKNPKDADAKGHIQSTSGTHRYAWAMAQHESRQDGYGNRVYNQFNAGGPTKEIPNFSGNYPDEDGWGMAQLDRPLGVSATTAELYSWHQNMSKFYAELDGKKSDAERFIRWIKNLWGSDSRWEEPPATWRISSSSFSPVELATIVLYNGASGIPTSSGKDDSGAPRSFKSPWIFDPTKPAGQRWKFHDNTNPVNNLHYAATVIQDEWEHGQPTSE